MFSLCPPAEPTGRYTGVRSGNSKMTDKDGEIVFNTRAKHKPSEAVTSGTTPPDSSGTKMDAIMEALQSVSI